MAWGISRSAFGVCGNFKFEFHDLTDVKATRSCVPITYSYGVWFTTSVNTTDNTDVFGAQKLAWTGTADTDTVNELDDSGETFDPRLLGLVVENTTDNVQARVAINSSDATRLLLYKNDLSAAYDAFPDGNESFILRHDRVVQLTAGTANDDGYLLIFG